MAGAKDPSVSTAACVSHVQQALAALPEAQWKDENRAVCETLFSSPIFRVARVVGVFPPSRGGVNVVPIIKTAMSEKKRCFIATFPTPSSLKMVEVSPSTDLLKWVNDPITFADNPDQRELLTEPATLDSVDLLLFPNLAFDPEQNSFSQYAFAEKEWLEQLALARNGHLDASTSSTISPKYIGLALQPQMISDTLLDAHSGHQLDVVLHPGIHPQLTPMMTPLQASLDITIGHLLSQNRKWAASMEQEHPGFFDKLSKQQSPKILWVGCSDSRVPANQITGMLPGEIFVHRNIANQVSHIDLNCLSVLQYAVEVLKVEHIIVCGHYGCGGVMTALRPVQLGLIDNWIRLIKDVARRHATELARVTDPEEKANLLSELNVKTQVENICHTSIVQNAWHRGQKLFVHGLIYGVHNGQLKNLVFPSIGSIKQISPLHRVDLSL